MTFTFKPFTDEEIEKLDEKVFLADGKYNFEVVKSSRGESKAGNPKCELQLKVWDNEGNIYTVFACLVFSSVKLCVKYVKNFCYCIGLEKEYLSGSIPEELAGYSGKCLIGIKDKEVNPAGGFYAKKNYVVDWLPATISENKISGMKPLEKVPDDFDDDVPF